MKKVIKSTDGSQVQFIETLDSIQDKLDKIKELKVQKKLYKAEEDLQKLDSNYNRARSITAGTAFGGVTEVNMRGENAHMWCIMQPAEVIEFIHQLAGAVGCHINIQPRNDFGSWRGWRTDSDNLLPFISQNHAPHAKVDHSKQIGLEVPIAIPIPSQKLGEQNETLAITKTVNKRKSKRTTTPT